MLGTATRLQNARTISLSGAVSGSTSFNGSGNVTITTTQANIAVLTGTLEIGGTKSLPYPDGYNKNNCIPLPIMTSFKSNYSIGTVFDTISSARGGIPATLFLGDSNMTLYCKNIYLNNGEYPVIGTSEMNNFKYRIVLLKIS